MDLLASFLGEKCFTTMIENEQFLDPDCVKLVISKLLGICIILGALIVKVPQIITILVENSAKGLAITSTYLELFAYTIIIAYNFQKGYDFSTYGEVIFIFIQNIILLYLITYYQNRENLFQFYPISLGFIVFLVCLGYVLPEKISELAFVYTNTPVIILSRLPQIYENFTRGNTGALSLITYFLQFAGSLARVFTTLQQTGDIVSLIGYATASMLNGIIFFQILFTSHHHKKKVN